MDLAAAGLTGINEGTIGSAYHGVSVDAIGVTFTNSGAITAGFVGIAANARGTTGLNDESGEIVAALDGISIWGDCGRVENRGSIMVAPQILPCPSVAIEALGSDLEVVNSGTLEGPVGVLMEDPDVLS